MGKLKATIDLDKEDDGLSECCVCYSCYDNTEVGDPLWDKTKDVDVLKCIECKKYLCVDCMVKILQLCAPMHDRIGYACPMCRKRNIIGGRSWVQEKNKCMKNILFRAGVTNTLVECDCGSPGSSVAIIHKPCDDGSRKCNGSKLMFVNVV